MTLLMTTTELTSILEPTCVMDQGIFSNGCETHFPKSTQKRVIFAEVSRRQCGCWMKAITIPDMRDSESTSPPGFPQWLEPPLGPPRCKPKRH